MHTAYEVIEQGWSAAKYPKLSCTVVDRTNPTSQEWNSHPTCAAMWTAGQQLSSHLTSLPLKLSSSEQKPCRPPSVCAWGPCSSLRACSRQLPSLAVQLAPGLRRRWQAGSLGEEVRGRNGWGEIVRVRQQVIPLVLGLSWTFGTDLGTDYFKLVQSGMRGWGDRGQDLLLLIFCGD